MMKALASLVLAVLLLPTLVRAQAPAAAPPTDARAAFRICDSEGFMALNIARNYMLGRRNREAVLPYVQGSAFAQGLAFELFDRVDMGQVQHYADFAAEKLYACASRERLDLQEPIANARICYARTDIPFFLHGDRDAGLDRKNAESRTAARLRNPDVYPPALIRAVGDAVYGNESDLRKLMGTVFWSCLHNEAWKRP